MMSHRGIVARAVVCTALFSFASCTAVLDPRRFEQVEYGMPHAEVEQALEVAVRDRLRVLPAHPGDSEWVVDCYWSEHPHPHYVVAYRDGELASVLHQTDLPEDVRYVGAPLGAEAMRAVVEQLAQERHPLQWQQLQPIDRAAYRSDMNPTAYTLLMVMVFPPALVGLAISPLVLLTMPLVEGDVHELRKQRSAQALSLPAGCSRNQALARMGEPKERRLVDGEPDVELWDYWVADNLTSDFSCRLGFVADRLRWVQANRPGTISLGTAAVEQRAAR